MTPLSKILATHWIAKRLERRRRNSMLGKLFAVFGAFFFTIILAYGTDAFVK